MAKLSEYQGGFEVPVMFGDEEIKFNFREPTPQEENEYESRKTKARKGKVKNQSFLARLWLFDNLFVDAPGLEDDAGKPVTSENNKQIPNKLKSETILHGYDLRIDISLGDDDTEEVEGNGKKGKN